MAGAQENPVADKRYAFWTTGVAVYACWNAATLIGALVGSSIDPQTFGLDVAFAAGFVAMVLPHLRHRRGLLAAVLGGDDLPRAHPVHTGRRADPVLRSRSPRRPPGATVMTWSLVLLARRRCLRLQVPRARGHRLPDPARAGRALPRARPRRAAQRPHRPGHVRQRSGPRARRTGAGVVVAVVLAWRRAPFVVVVAAAAATTALLRQLYGIGRPACLRRRSTGSPGCSPRAGWPWRPRAGRR